MRKLMNKKPSPINYLKLATPESRVRELLNEDQKELEHLVFENEHFHKYKSTLRAIKNHLNFPQKCT